MRHALFSILSTPSLALPAVVLLGCAGWPVHSASAPAASELMLGEKLPSEPPPATWLARLGNWRVLNSDPGFPITDLTLKLTDGQLCLSYRMPAFSSKRIQVPVRAAGPDSGIILGLGRARGETVRIVNQDGKPRLRWSGYLAERVEQTAPDLGEDP